MFFLNCVSFGTCPIESRPAYYIFIPLKMISLYITSIYVHHHPKKYIEYLCTFLEVISYLKYMKYINIFSWNESYFTDIFCTKVWMWISSKQTLTDALTYIITLYYKGNRTKQILLFFNIWLLPICRGSLTCKFWQLFYLQINHWCNLDIGLWLLLWPQTWHTVAYDAFNSRSKMLQSK